MRLDDLIADRAVRLDLRAKTPAGIRTELVAALGIRPPGATRILALLRKREELGSTAVGRGIAIPHCRTLSVTRLHLAFGLAQEGVDWDAVDGRPVYAVFLVLAPPVEVVNQYLQVLGHIAQLTRERDALARLRALESVEDFSAFLRGRG